MNDNLPTTPVYPYEVIRDHGAYLVMRNTALVNEVRLAKERIARAKLNEMSSEVRQGPPQLKAVVNTIRPAA